MTTPFYLTALSQLGIATLHGYFGAWLAVRMVFRPRRALYVFGIRLPFTPGMIPAEREHFLNTFAHVIAERVLTVETIADEILNLGIRTEIEEVSARNYTEQTTTETFIRKISERLVRTLEDTQKNERLANRLDSTVAESVVAAASEKYGFLGKTVATILVDAGLIRKIVAASFQDIADQLSRNPLSRAALLEALAEAGQQIFPSREPTGELVALVSRQDVSLIDEFVLSLSRRLNIERILKEQLAALNDEMIEDMIYRAAGRELQIIIQFGALVGFGVGIVQALLVLFS